MASGAHLKFQIAGRSTQCSHRSIRALIALVTPLEPHFLAAPRIAAELGFDMDDEAFIAAVENASFPNGTFRHGEHLRAAYLYLRRYGYPRGIDTTTSAIRAFAIANGMPHAFHLTVTVAWVRCIAGHSHDACAQPFETFLSHNAELMDSGLLLRFYSPERLFSTAARTDWREPDRCPLPPVTPWKPGPRHGS